ncbi:MAG: phage head-tail connector protein [Xanthobacteraceae bacterium]|nr:phage head-tail connector protein [Xanthobacteraceae bacterium]
MPLTVLQPALTHDLISLAAAKSALDITGSDQDAKLSAWISQASAAISTYAGRTFAAEKVEQVFRPANGTIGLVLERFPISTVHSIVEGDTTLTSTDYEADLVAGVLNRLWTSRYACWSTTVVTVTYTAGYETIPANLQRACIICLQHYRSGADRDPAIRSEAITDIETLQYFAPTGDALPIEAEALVRPFRVPKVG